jgi:protein-tyrosine-phosphatase
MTFGLKRLVPTSLRRWRNVLASLTPDERQALLRSAIDATLHPRRRDWRDVVRNGHSFVLVCHGNIIRSPIAAAALAREAAARGRGVQISSAGLSARPGEPADPRAMDSAAERGLLLADHRSRLLDAPQVQSADVIFVMDHLNLGRILARFPDAADRVFLLGGCRLDGGTALTEIHDPVSGTLADVNVAHDEVIAAVRRVTRAWDEPRA